MTPSGDEPLSKANPSRRWWLLLAAALLLGGGIALLLRMRPSAARIPDVTFSVLVGPPGRKEPISVEAPGALPVVPGGMMCLDVEYADPQFTYFVWINSAGRAIPLYPWNGQKVEVTDLSTPPPQRRAGKRVFSPLVGGSWTFGDDPGTETVLLLTRRTPRPESTNIGTLMGDLPPPPPAASSQELVILEVRDHAKSATTVVSRDRGDITAAKAADEALQALLLRLSPHFDLVRAVRFAHAAGTTDSNKKSEKNGG